MIHIFGSHYLPEGAVEFSHIRASGPGGQNVNKVASAIQIRFDAMACEHLPQEWRKRLPTIAGSRMSKEGVIVLTGDRFRTQEANRRDVIDRLTTMLRRASVKPKARIPTRPTKSSKRQRLDTKTRRATVKRARGPVDLD